MVGFRRGCGLLSVSIIALCTTLVYLYGTRADSEWRKISTISDLGDYLADANGQDYGQKPANSTAQLPNADPILSKPMPAEPSYVRHLIVAKTKDEEADWLHQEDLKGVVPKIYVPDDPSASLTVPANKGHEAMVYLTYIIDHYESLPDVAIFMHAHRKSWHQPGLLEHDGAETVRRLSSSRVLRQGYMNLRCEWTPGCPKWMHPKSPDPNSPKLEESVMARAWTELFPTAPIPDVLSQPCCAQFALSKERILSIPRERFVLYRDWLLQTKFDDEISGRVFEYTWQFIFTNEAVFCPDMHVCYCDGFGLCFENDKAFDYWFEIRWKKHVKEEELEVWRSRVALLDHYRQNGELTDIEDLELQIPSAGVDVRLLAEIEKFESLLEEDRQKAIERGKDPAIRARVSGRNWTEGDGF